MCAYINPVVVHSCRSRELQFHFPDNNRVLEEYNVTGYEETMPPSSYLLTGETDVIGKERMVREEHSSGYKVVSISKVFKSIAMLQLFNSCERKSGKTKGIPKHKEQSKVSLIHSLQHLLMNTYVYK